jgi:hypothetical protein
MGSPLDILIKERSTRYDRYAMTVRRTSVAQKYVIFTCFAPERVCGVPGFAVEDRDTAPIFRRLLSM